MPLFMEPASNNKRNQNIALASLIFLLELDQVFVMSFLSLFEQPIEGGN